MGKGKKNKAKKCMIASCKNDAGKGQQYCGTHKGKSTWFSGGTYQHKPKPACHTGQKSVFTVGDIEVFAGGRNRNGGWQKMDEPADLAMGPSETLGSWGASKTEVPEGWACGDTLTSYTPLIISLDWPDFSIPKVSAKFWYALIEDIKEHNIKRISCQCAGGHGRTGVQLAILAYLLSGEKQRAEMWPDAAELIKWVRKAHCHHAVEAQSQQRYIADVCVIPLGEMLIADRPSYGGWSGNGNLWTDINDVDDDKIMTLADAMEDEAATMDEELLHDIPDETESESCPICTGELDDAYCQTCHADVLTWDEDTTLHESYCPMCDGETPTAYMVENLQVCCMCHADTLGLTVRQSQQKIKCGDCNKFKPAYQFFTMDSEETTCAQCYHGLTTKRKRKPKKVE